MNEKELNRKIASLEKELRKLRELRSKSSDKLKSVIVPEPVTDLFLSVEKRICSYFNDLVMDPENGEITAQGQRYVLLRTDSLSHEFIDFIVERYNERPKNEAISIGNNFLYDNAKVLGKKDSLAFHRKLDLKDAVDCLSAGPIHFAYTGWANVEILPESNPVPNENYFLKFHHHNSFEAQSWIKAEKKSKIPVCTMNCGYSAGWCEESFGILLTTVEVTCEAKGDANCTFIMAPTDKIEQYLKGYTSKKQSKEIEIPVFFKRQKIEAELRSSIEQKEMLIKEIHHRVKNNLQVISSLLRLQMDSLENDEFKHEFESTINRVMTMATVHELMYQKKNFNQVNLQSYMEEIVTSLVLMYKIRPDTRVNINIQIPEVDVNLDKSIPLALILNEIICNSFKHGIEEGGELNIEMKESNGTFNIRIGDNGRGISGIVPNGGLGLALIEILCEQIDAVKTVENSKIGLSYTLEFDLKE